MQQRRPIGIDLFAGAGGLALGFEQAGFDVLTSVEYDPVHAAVHAFNFPQTEVLCADVALLSADGLRAAAERGWLRHGNEGTWHGEIDVIFGGPPCQGFSTIGKRLIDDKRNQLVFHFFRLVAELKPRYFVLENVPGMLAGGHLSILKCLIDEFEQIGYQIASPPQVLCAADFGVPQDRKRLFLLGAHPDQRLPRYPTPTTCPAPKRSAIKNQQLNILPSVLPPGPIVNDALGGLPDLDLFSALLETDEVSLCTEHLEEMERQKNHYTHYIRGLIEETQDFSITRFWDRTLLTSSMRTEHTEASIARFAETLPGHTEPISRFYRLDPKGLSNTLRAGTGSERGAYTSPRPIHPFLPRVISVREAARLHSFPDWFRLHKTKWHGFREIGNSVPPLLGRAVGNAIIDALDVQPFRSNLVIELGSTELLGFTMKEAAAYFGAHADHIPAQRRRISHDKVLQ
ncbi:MAG: DNA cytosine methyltransferase [Anaerolineae bacterium]|nr:DNA cytosine methyltransferase [Gloeobacterales cyanobacterium ES-bin-313]